jgi:hypothetical protein
VTHLDCSPLFYIYIIIKNTTYLNNLSFCTSTIDTQTNVQKRKRADTVPNEYAINLAELDGLTIIVDHLRHGLPSNIEEDSEDSDVDQPNDEPLEKSTLF